MITFVFAGYILCSCQAESPCIQITIVSKHNSIKLKASNADVCGQANNHTQMKEMWVWKDTNYCSLWWSESSGSAKMDIWILGMYLQSWVQWSKVTYKPLQMFSHFHWKFYYAWGQEAKHSYTCTLHGIKHLTHCFFSPYLLFGPLFTTRWV